MLALRIILTACPWACCLSALPPVLCLVLAHEFYHKERTSTYCFRSCPMLEYWEGWILTALRSNVQIWFLLGGEKKSSKWWLLFCLNWNVAILIHISHCLHESKAVVFSYSRLIRVRCWCLPLYKRRSSLWVVRAAVVLVSALMDSINPWKGMMEPTVHRRTAGKSKRIRPA